MSSTPRSPLVDGVASPSADTLIEDATHEPGGPGSSRRVRDLLRERARTPVDDGALDDEDDDAHEAAMPARLGRFTPLRRIGAGAMGVVYSAYDELLDRGVAIKLLRRDRSQGQARMLREAQALARLSHPNVVQVYDVGEHLGHLFVAMEFVRGRTLREWLVEGADAGERRSLPASGSAGQSRILDVFIQAGEGLAAAHAAGIVHRDFKPDNVLVGDDGRARVVDFGLAAAGGRPEGEVDAGASAPAGLGELDDLTRTGMLLGTPAYMPPEQLVGGVADARSDVFAFCVSLLEAIAGGRPFAGRSVGDLLQSIHDGVPRETIVRAPPWLRPVIERGLAADPDARWPTIRALLDALAQDPARRRRRWLALAGAAAVVVAGVVAIGATSEARALRCQARSDAILAVWDAPARGRVTRALAATGVVHARDTAARVAGRVDAWTGEWRAARAGLCVAEERGDRLALAEASCLEGHRWRLRALVDAFAGADAGMVNRAVSAVTELPPIDRCHDLRWLRVDVDRDAHAADRERLARTRGLLSAGAYAAAREAVAPLIDAEAPAIRAEARLLDGAIDRQIGEIERSVERFEGAYYLAGEVGADVVAAEAAVLAMAAVGTALSKHEEGLTWGRSAAMMIGRAGLAEAELGARYLVTLGVIERQRGRFDEALAAYERALAIFRRDLGPRHPSVARALNNIGTALAEKHDRAGSAERIREALAIFEEVYGPEHPDVAIFLGNLGAALDEDGRQDEARPLFQRALAVGVANFGPDHPFLADVRVNLAYADLTTGDAASALVTVDEALATLRTRPPGRERAYAEVIRARALHALGRGDEALAAVTVADELITALEVPSLRSTIRFLQARLLWDRGGDPAAARVLAVEALELYEAEGGEDRSIAEVRRWLDEHPAGGSGG
ncbi:MAG: serine/threonine-protein kinase [Nannocystaceae bacterium]